MSRRAWMICAAGGAALCGAKARGDDSGPQEQIEAVANGLTAGNPAQAMAPFDKSYPKYDRLSDDFGSLTSAFSIVNEIEVTDVQQMGAQCRIDANWTMTLTDLGSNATQRRAGAIHANLVSKGRRWKIVDFGPIDLFEAFPKH